MYIPEKVRNIVSMDNLRTSSLIEWSEAFGKLAEVSFDPIREWKNGTREPLQELINELSKMIGELPEERLPPDARIYGLYEYSLMNAEMLAGLLVPFEEVWSIIARSSPKSIQSRSGSILVDLEHEKKRARATAVCVVRSVLRNDIEGLHAATEELARMILEASHNLVGPHHSEFRQRKEDSDKVNGLWSVLISYLGVLNEK